jgi:uncharacterized protein involved in exopolysaccharide biosynthesis
MEAPGRFDIFDLSHRLLEDWRLVAAIAAGFALISIAVSLLLPPVYQATTLLKPQSGDGGMGSLARQYGGLASLAGVALPSGDSESKSQLAIEVLKSKKFAYDFVMRHEILPQFFSPGSWDWASRRLSIDSSDFDSSSGQWVRKVKPPRIAEPKAEEVHEKWLEALTIKEDKDTGFITVSFEHRSPVFAKEWLEYLVTDVNEALRSQDLFQAQRAVGYLEDKLKETNVSEIRELLANLLRSHMESQMMASVEPDYAFSIVDPPTVPELKSHPKRTLIVVLSTLFGGLLGVFISLFRAVIREHRAASLERSSA